MPPISSPPDDWDPATVTLLLPPPLSGSETETERIKIIKLHKWKYAAGDTGDKTERRATRAHEYARKRVWDIVMANRARVIDKDKQTDEQKVDIQKVDNWWAYRQSRIGTSRGSSMIPPPTKWRPELAGETRTEKWRYAAGPNNDGSAKKTQNHNDARKSIIRKFRLTEAKRKDPCDRTTEDLKVIAAEVTRKANKSKRDKARDMKRLKAQQDVCTKYLENHPELLVATDTPLTEEDAFDIALKLFDDKESEYGKKIFNVLGSKTLRQVLYDVNSSTSIYIGAGRGFGDESYRFLVHNGGRCTTVLTREDGTNFKSKDQDYKNLKLESVEVGHFSSWSDCTAVEAALQLILDDLEIGSQRLWLQSGIGRDQRQLRVRDAKRIEKLKADGEDGNLTFVCFITILRNVEVLSRYTDTVTGKDVVESIKAGSGTVCRVHQPKRPKPRSDPAQKAALEATRLKLGFNCIDINHKRKLDDFLSAESEDQESSECSMSEDEQGSAESENESDE